jgi:hypothetical protein
MNVLPVYSLSFNLVYNIFSCTYKNLRALFRALFGEISLEIKNRRLVGKVLNLKIGNIYYVK